MSEAAGRNIWEIIGSAGAPSSDSQTTLDANAADNEALKILS